MISQNEQLTPREAILIDNEKEENRRAREHALAVSKLNVQQKITELKLRQAEGTKARIHAQKMKEVELAIRREDTKWQNLLRLPRLLIMLPVYIVLAFGATILLVKKGELPEKVYQLLK